MNPFEEKPKSIKNYPMDWKTLYAAPYDKNTVDPHTKCRIILMNGIEVESVMFQHNFHRNCGNNDLRRDLAEVRRNEQEQQKQVNWQYIGKNGRDYRSEEAENPVPALQDRKADNTEIGRIK